MEGRELVARRRGDRFGIAEARGRNAIGMLGAVERGHQHALRDRTRFVEFGLQPVELLRADALQLLRVERRRSEEHTSELQSLMRISYAVFCLKKKNTHH